MVWQYVIMVLRGYGKKAYLCNKINMNVRYAPIH